MATPRRDPISRFPVIENSTDFSIFFYTLIEKFRFFDFFRSVYARAYMYANFQVSSTFGSVVSAEYILNLFRPIV